MVLLGWLRAHGLRLVVHLGALLPLGWLVWAYWQGLFFVDPVSEIMNFTGKTALILLLLSLSCTPVYAITGFSTAIRVRRALGLYSFLYVGLHFLTFVGLDYGFDFALLRQAIFEQRYVLTGFVSGLLLLPLAITSTSRWQKRLGKNWRWLHRLVYVAGILAILHFLWFVKDAREPLRYGASLAVLLILRLPGIRKAVNALCRRLRSRISIQTRSQAKS
jgi:sulfoxide reductase heme-binding subunit YedZ